MPSGRKYQGQRYPITTLNETLLSARCVTILLYFKWPTTMRPKPMLTDFGFHRRLESYVAIRIYDRDQELERQVVHRMEQIHNNKSYLFYSVSWDFVPNLAWYLLLPIGFTRSNKLSFFHSRQEVKKKYLLAKVNPIGMIYFGVLIALLQDSVTIFEVKLIKFRQKWTQCNQDWVWQNSYTLIIYFFSVQGIVLCTFGRGLGGQHFKGFFAMGWFYFCLYWG